MDINDVALNVLDFVVVLSVGDARAEPGEKLSERAGMIRPGFGGQFTGDLDFQVLRPRQPQRGRQINQMDIRMVGRPIGARLSSRRTRGRAFPRRSYRLGRELNYTGGWR